MQKKRGKEHVSTYSTQQILGALNVKEQNDSVLGEPSPCKTFGSPIKLSYIESATKGPYAHTQEWVTGFKKLANSE